MTPALIGAICLEIGLELFGSGPLFHPQITKPFTEGCRQNWWTNILYINNWFDPRDYVNNNIINNYCLNNNIWKHKF